MLSHSRPKQYSKVKRNLDLQDRETPLLSQRGYGGGVEERREDRIGYVHVTQREGIVNDKWLT